MPTWEQMKIFTWEEMKYFKWSEAAIDILSFANTCKEKELCIPESVRRKVIQLCEEEFEKYSKILGKTDHPTIPKLSTIADILGIIGFLQSILSIPEVSQIAHNLYSLLIALLNGQMQ